MHKLLVLDDEPIIVNTLGDYLAERFDAEIFRTTSAFEAMELLRQTRFDLVITDIRMPEMDGIEILRFVKRYWPACHVIILTAYDTFDYVYKAIGYERVDYVLKAEGYPAILEKVRAALEQLEREREQERLFVNIGRRIEEIAPSLQADILNRLLKRGEALPAQAELDAVRFPLRRDAPVLPVMAILDAEHLLNAKAAYAEVTQYARPRLQQRGVALMAHRAGCYGLWLAQCGDDVKPEDALLFVKDVFELVPELSESGVNINLVVAQGFQPWDRLQHVYECEIATLELRRGQRGASMLSAEDETRYGGKRDLAAFGRVTELWELLRTGQKEAFERLGYPLLSQMSEQRDVTECLPSPIVSGAAFLYQSAVGLYGVDSLIDARARRVLNAFDHPTGEQWIEEVRRLFALLFEKKAEVCGGDVDWVIQKVKRYIEENYKRDIHLSLIAERFHYSQAYLSRMYKACTGSNLTTYINDLRVAFAKQRLTDTLDPVRDVAIEAGFYSAKYFTQAFKKATGVTPRQWRERSETD